MENVISASMVRDLIARGKISLIKHIVTSSTWKFLNSKVWKKIIEEIRDRDSSH